MNAQDTWLFRLAIISALVRAAQTKLGRTSVMKLAYFLQTLKDVPLGYNFRLYTYGPYDSNVLADLSHAEAMHAVKSRIVRNASGYGYEFSPGQEPDVIKQLIGTNLEAYQGSVDWVAAEFSGMTASDLELLSTIVYADREATRDGQPLPAETLCQRVQRIKPRFAAGYIQGRIAMLRNKNLLTACHGSSDRD
jgi:uncharacterized protein